MTAGEQTHVRADQLVPGDVIVHLGRHITVEAVEQWSFYTRVETENGEVVLTYTDTVEVVR